MSWRAGTEDFGSTKKKFRAPAVPTVMSSNVSDRPASALLVSHAATSNFPKNDTTTKKLGLSRSFDHRAVSRKTKYRAPPPPKSTDPNPQHSYSSGVLKIASSHKDRNVSNSIQIRNDSPDSSSRISQFMIKSVAADIEQHNPLTEKSVPPPRPLRVHRATSMTVNREQTPAKRLSAIVQCGVSATSSKSVVSLPISSKHQSSPSCDSSSTKYILVNSEAINEEMALSDDVSKQWHPISSSNHANNSSTLRAVSPGKYNHDKLNERESDSEGFNVDIDNFSESLHISATDGSHCSKDVIIESSDVDSEKTVVLDSSGEMVRSRPLSKGESESLDINRDRTAIHRNEQQECQVGTVSSEIPADNWPLETNTPAAGNLNEPVFVSENFQIGESPDCVKILNSSFHSPFESTTRCIEKHQSEYDRVLDYRQYAGLNASSTESSVDELSVDGENDFFSSSRRNPDQLSNESNSDMIRASDVEKSNDKTDQTMETNESMNSGNTNYTNILNTPREISSVSRSKYIGAASNSEKRVNEVENSDEHGRSTDRLFDNSYVGKKSDSIRRPFFSIQPYSDRDARQEYTHTDNLMKNDCSNSESNIIGTGSGTLRCKAVSPLENPGKNNSFPRRSQSTCFQLRSAADGRNDFIEGGSNSSKQLSFLSQNKHSMTLQRFRVKPSPVVVNRLDKMCRVQNELEARVAANFRVSRSNSLRGDSKPTVLPKSASLVRLYHTSRFVTDCNEHLEKGQNGRNINNNACLVQPPRVIAEESTNRCTTIREGSGRDSLSSVDSAPKHPTSELSDIHVQGKQCSSFFNGIQAFSERVCLDVSESEMYTNSASEKVPLGISNFQNNKSEDDNVIPANGQCSLLPLENQSIKKAIMVSHGAYTDSSTCSRDEKQNFMNKYTETPTRKKSKTQKLDKERPDHKVKTELFIGSNPRSIEDKSSYLGPSEVFNLVCTSSPKQFNVNIKLSPYSSGCKDVRAEIASLSPTSVVSSESYTSPDQMSIKDRMKWLQSNQHVIMGRYKNFIQNC